jgi:biotin carboxylase
MRNNSMGSDAMTTLMMVGASRYQAPAFEIARQLGFRVVAIDRNPNAEAAPLADLFEAIDVKSTSEALALAGRESVSGTFTMQSDVGIRTVGEINERLRLPGIGIACAEACSDKTLMRDALALGGVRQPEYGFATTADQAVGHAKSIGTGDGEGSR